MGGGGGEKEKKTERDREKERVRVNHHGDFSYYCPTHCMFVISKPN